MRKYISSEIIGKIYINTLSTEPYKLIADIVDLLLKTKDDIDHTIEY